MYPEKFFKKEALNFVPMLPDSGDINKGVRKERIWCPPENADEQASKGYWFPFAIISVVYTKKEGKILTRKELGAQYLQVLMVDSGGYQLKRGKVQDIPATKTIRIQQDIGDIGFLIDVADKFMLTKPIHVFERFIQKSKVKADLAYPLWNENKMDLFMTVHGGTHEQCQLWHDTVANGRDFSGVAFGNVDFPDLCDTLKGTTPIGARDTHKNRISITRRNRFLRELDRLYMARMLGYQNLHYFGVATHNQKMDVMLYALKKVPNYKNMFVSIDSSLYFRRMKEAFYSFRGHMPYSNGMIAKIQNVCDETIDKKCNCYICQHHNIPLFDDSLGTFVVIKGEGMLKVNDDGSRERVNNMKNSGMVRFALATHNVSAIGDWHDSHNKMTAEQLRDVTFRNFLLNDQNTYLYFAYIDYIAKKGYVPANDWYEENLDMIPSREEAVNIVHKSMNRLKGIV